MKSPHSRFMVSCLSLWGAVFASSYVSAAVPVPEGSLFASSSGERQLELYSLVEDGAVAEAGAWKMAENDPEPYPGLEAKVGDEVLRFSGTAEIGGAKGDFRIRGDVSGSIKAVGMWFYLPPDANVDRVGFQVVDEEWESLAATVDADWTGWKWVEMEVSDELFNSAYKQKGKDESVNFPVRSVSIIWFSKTEGPTELGVDGLMALTENPSPKAPFTVSSISSVWGESGATFGGRLLVNNFEGEALNLSVQYSLRENPQYRTPTLPKPGLGSDHAQGQLSWMVSGGERIEDGSLTDGDDDTMLKPALKEGARDEFFQLVDLGQIREVTAIEVKAGDGNWSRKIAVEAAVDGGDFEPIEGLERIDLKDQWSFVSLPLENPVEMRYLKIRHFDDEEGVLPPHFRTLASIHVYDGVEDETIEIPPVGELVMEDTVEVNVPPRSFEIIDLPQSGPLGPNAYQFGILYEDDEGTEISLADYFVMPEGEIEIRPESRFGVNVNSPRYIPQITRAGFGWIRFENMKWPFYNPAPGDFRFDGSVGPWNVPMDPYFQEFHEAGISILPYIFETPQWASSAPKDIKKGRRKAYPPKNNDDYTKGIFQGVARFGSNQLPKEEVLTPDSRSGLGYIETFELWNEPNLTNPSWGFFVGTLDEFYRLYRAGVEGLRAADPNARSANGGWAGIAMDWIDTMRTYTYDDGKTPLDFTDVLSVHFYTGKQDPETATRDPNANRTGKGEASSKTLEEYLRDLADWRDRLKPEMPIWVTETGYDVGGPIGRTERLQATKIPRSLLIAYANGVEKAMIYRIQGSTPAMHAGGGLFRNDGSVRASYFTVSTLIRQLDEVTAWRSHRLRTEDSRLWIYLWKEKDGYMVSVHTPEDEMVPLGLDFGECRVTNAFGAEEVMEVDEDFAVGQFPIYLREIENGSVIDALLEQAIAREVYRRQEMAFLESAPAYLIDFGSDEHVGKMKVGVYRSFETAEKEDAYDPEKGYGFTEKVPGKNISAHWIKSLLEKDYIQLHRPTTFRIDALPGTYVFQFKGMKYRDGGTLVVRGGRGGDIEVPIPFNNDASPTEPVTVTVVEGRPIEVDLPPSFMQWMTLIPVFQ